MLYSGQALIDTSVVIALFDPSDQFYDEARRYFQENAAGFVWATLNETSHELYTRVRFQADTQTALKRYDFLRSGEFHVLDFDSDDENSARSLIEQYEEHTISFHDALCAAIMSRAGIYKIFSFDHDFWTLGFEVHPGQTS